MRLPSGDQTGEESRAPEVSSRTREPSISTIQRLLRLVFDFINPGASEDDLSAVRRDCRIADALHVHESLFVEQARLRLGYRCPAEKEHNRDDKQMSGLHRDLLEMVGQTGSLPGFPKDYMERVRANWQFALPSRRDFHYFMASQRHMKAPQKITT